MAAIHPSPIRIWRGRGRNRPAPSQFQTVQRWIARGGRERSFRGLRSFCRTRASRCGAKGLSDHHRDNRPPTTKASEDPNPLSDQERRARAGLIMPESARPAPNRVPLTSEARGQARPYPPITWRIKKTFAKPAAMKVAVAAMERGDRRTIPQTP